MVINANLSQVLWLTGTPCSGKTSIGEAVQKKLGEKVVFLDGDEVRKTLSKDLSHGAGDRKTNLDRVLRLIDDLVEKKSSIIAAFVSPDKALRAYTREHFKNKGVVFAEVWVKANPQTCEKRDVKGLYKQFREGNNKILLPGLNDNYDEPDKPELICETDKETLEDSINKVCEFFLKDKT